MSFLPESPELPKPVSPEFLLGAASPLWAYFGAFAASGMAWWWMTRIAPQNLEAMFAALPSAESLAPVLEAASAELPAQPVGGEAVPVSPLLEAATPPVVPPEPATFADPSSPPEPEPQSGTVSKFRRPPPAAPAADA